MQSLIEHLEQGHSEALTAHLTAMGRFHNYNFGNILEIARQKPNATRVAGFYAWNQLGRKVKKGEHGVQLTKAKAAEGIKNSYLELQRSRQLAQLARRMVVSAGSIVDVSYQPDNPDVESGRAKMEADMFRAELEYRQAYARLRGLMGGK